MNRRDFLRRASAVAASAAVPVRALAVLAPVATTGLTLADLKRTVAVMKENVIQPGHRWVMVNGSVVEFV